MSSSWVDSVIGQLGPFGVFLLMVPESACVPVPSELTLLCAGFAVSQGWMSIWSAVLAATAGNLAGSLIAYGLGRMVIKRAPSGRAQAALAGCESLFRRHGVRTVFIARLMPLARTFVSLPAGYMRVPLAPFVGLTLAGCAIWSLGFVLVGISAGAGWSSLGPRIGDLMSLVAVVALTVLWLRHAKGRRSPRARRSRFARSRHRPSGWRR